MSAPLTKHSIRMLCGRFSYEDGEELVKAGRVALVKGEEAGAPGNRNFTASVSEGPEVSGVSVCFTQDEEIFATCSCPAYHPDDQYCKHIAAALLDILDLHATEEAGRPDNAVSPAENEDKGLTSQILELFDPKPRRLARAGHFFDTRTVLDVEFICKPVPDGKRTYLLAVELKVGAGTKRLHIVKNVWDFLDRVDRGALCAISRHFTYDPELHSFQKETDAVLQVLIRMLHRFTMYPAAAAAGSDRLLPIPAALWDELMPLLASAPSVKVMQDNLMVNGIAFTEETLPLVFEFDQPEGQSEGYLFRVQGMDRLIVLEAYGVVLTEGKLVKLTDNQLKQLLPLMAIFEKARRHRLRISPVQAEPFLERVVPGLMKLGTVHIAQTVSDRLVRLPLKAKLYLDRVRDRLLAGLEFQYGDIVINPLEGPGENGGKDRILLRDGEKERAILGLMEQQAFTRTEGGFILSDEEDEYAFLYYVVPQLEKLVQIYATTAVKERLHLGPIHPKVIVESDERTDWLEFQFDISGIPEQEIRSLVRSLEEKRTYHRLPNGALLPLDSREFQEMIRFINETGIRLQDVTGNRARLPIARALHLAESVPGAGKTIQFGKSFRRVLESLRNPDHLEFPVPEELGGILRDYQRYGFQWMRTLSRYRFGGILADEMGLGKTIQSIAFLASVLPEIRERGTAALVVSPASLLYNWQHELARFAPHLRVAVADGSREEREAFWKRESGIDVIITSYPLLRQDFTQYAKRQFHTLIFDEAQAFKNHSTQTAQAVKALKAHHRFALTGTPMENRLEELWSIYDVVFPGLFPERKAFGDLSGEAVAKRIRPFLLRRLKSDVLKELPDKIESTQASPLLPEQKKLYVAYLAELRQEAIKHLHSGDLQRNRIKILAGLTRLRQLCCHPALFVNGYEGGSAKFEQLLGMLEEFRMAGRRTLVFSQFTEMLGLIGRELGRQGVSFFYLDGQTPARERVELCSRFNQGEQNLFLLSLKAGGTGLNLTGADTIILYDLWWNPAVEQQAADRAHRIGQKQVVQVIRLVAKGTMEEKMVELQQRKKHLIDEVIRPGQMALAGLSEDEIRELLMI